MRCVGWDPEELRIFIVHKASIFTEWIVIVISNQHDLTI